MVSPAAAGPVIEDAAPMARCARWPEPAPRYRPLKEPATGEIIMGVPPVSQLMTPDSRDTASRPADLRPPGTPVSANRAPRPVAQRPASARRCIRAVSARAQGTPQIPTPRIPRTARGSVTEPQRSAVACQVTPICSLKCPSLSSNRPPPARCTIQASRMMTRMIRTIQITVTTKPGSTNLPTLATVATLAAAHAYWEDPEH